MFYLLTLSQTSFICSERGPALTPQIVQSTHTAAHRGRRLSYLNFLDLSFLEALCRKLNKLNKQWHLPIIKKNRDLN